MSAGASGLPSGWNVYYIVVLAGVLALSVPAVLYIASKLLSKKTPQAGSAAALVESQNPAQIGRKTNPRIFQAMNASLVLILIALLMIPCAVTLPKTFGLLCILSLSLIAGLCLIYGVRKHDLYWLQSFNDTEDASPRAKEQS